MEHLVKGQDRRKNGEGLWKWTGAIRTRVVRVYYIRDAHTAMTFSTRADLSVPSERFNLSRELTWGHYFSLEHHWDTCCTPQAHANNPFQLRFFVSMCMCPNLWMPTVNVGQHFGESREINRSRQGRCVFHTCLWCSMSGIGDIWYTGVRRSWPWKKSKWGLSYCMWSSSSSTSPASVESLSSPWWSQCWCCSDCYLVWLSWNTHCHEHSWAGSWVFRRCHVCDVGLQDNEVIILCEVLFIDSICIW